MKKLHITRNVFVFLLLALFIPTNAQFTPVPIEIGTKAPAFSLKGVDGKMYTLEDFSKHDILAIIFSTNHCPTSQAYEDRIIQIVKDYSARGVGFVMINPNNPAAVLLSELGYSDIGDSFEEMIIRAKDKEFNFPYLHDGETQEVSKAYGAVATPHAFVFDKKRTLRYVGRIDDTENPYVEPRQKDMINAIEALLNKKPVPVEKTKTFGCSVKWKDKSEWRDKVLAEWASAPVTVSMIDEQGVKDLMKNDGKNLRLINLWATWCGPCVTEFPDLVATDRMYRGRDFEFITISADKPGRQERVLDFLKKQQASNTNYHFNSEDVYVLVEAVNPAWEGGIPYTLLIEPGGKVLWSHLGVVDPLELRKQIIAYLGRYFADDK